MNAADLKKIMPLAGPLAEQFAEPLNAAMMAFNISTRQKQAAFLATVAHESGQLRSLSENLNYGAKGLMATWPKRFPTMDIAEMYAREPEKIANRVYANRMGNGDEASGDGWKYRGAGLIQLTGKENHMACAKEFGIPLDEMPIWLRTPEGASKSAAWFWRRSGCNVPADRGDMRAVTKIVNGGEIGLAERMSLYQIAVRVIV